MNRHSESRLRRELGRLLPPPATIREGLDRRHETRAATGPVKSRRRRGKVSAGALGGIAAVLLLSLGIGYLSRLGDATVQPAAQPEGLAELIATEVDVLFEESATTDDDVVWSLADEIVFSQFLDLGAVHEEVAEAILPASAP